MNKAYLAIFDELQRNFGVPSPKITLVLPIWVYVSRNLYIRFFGKEHSVRAKSSKSYFSPILIHVFLFN